MAIVILAVLGISAVLLIVFLLACSRRAKKEEEEFNRLMREQLALQARSLDAYHAMLREAGRFWEDNGENGY